LGKWLIHDCIHQLVVQIGRGRGRIRELAQYRAEHALLHNHHVIKVLRNRLSVRRRLELPLRLGQPFQERRSTSQKSTSDREENLMTCQNGLSVVKFPETFGPETT
jgi:hypothetical protein